MNLTAREIVDKWLKADINLAEIERVLEIPQRTLRLLSETEGPAEPEMEIMLNMVVARVIQALFCGSREF